MDILTPGSYGLIILVLILTGAGLPVPEELPILYAGYAASIQQLYWPWALGSCFIGALLGDCVLYSIGYHFGHTLAMKHPRIASLLHAEREKRVEKWIERHGLKVLLVVRFMVFLRAPVYLAVGILRMPMRRFVLIDSFCAAAVVSTFFGLSYAFGKKAQPYIERSEWLFTILVLLAVGAAVFWAWRKSRAASTSLAEMVEEAAEKFATPEPPPGDESNPAEPAASEPKRQD